MPRSSHSRTRGPLALVAHLAGALLILSLGAMTAFAKEGVEVSLAAPLPGDAEPGSIVTAVFNLKALTDNGESALRGSRVFLRLYGPTGAMTQAGGVEDRIPGTYRAQIEIPTGGAARAEFGIHGSTTDNSGKTVSSDTIWPYNGILLAAVVPPPVNPNAFQLPGAKSPVDRAANPAAQPAAQPVVGPTSAATETGPSVTIDGRIVGLVVLAALAMAGVTIGAGRRRRAPGSPA